LPVYLKAGIAEKDRKERKKNEPQMDADLVTGFGHAAGPSKTILQVTVSLAPWL
jgi:hypothetical protein